MKKTSATKKTAVPKAAAKTATPEKAKAAKKKIAAGPLGKTTGKPRTTWYMDYFRSHKANLPTDDKILAAAVAEFGQGHVGAGTVFQPKTMRSWWNTFCRRGSRGLTAKDAIVQTVESRKAAA